MRITFLTGGLEPGRDGVGDYSRLLAGACRKLGQEVTIIALNDTKVDGTKEGLVDGIPSLQIPTSKPWPQKWVRAGEFLSKYPSDWLSLQFVPYAFGKRGLFNEFLKGIPKLAMGKRVHLKFHEIWIGQYPQSPLKERLVGYLQKRLVRRLVRSLKPKVIHYTNAGAKIRLEQAGIRAQYLPVFSNIPLQPKGEENWIIQRLLNENVTIPDDNPDRFLFFGFFGSIHNKWPARQLLERLRMYTAAQSKRPALLHAGILPRTRNRWREIQKNYSGDWLIHSFGKLQDAEISSYLQSLDFGMTSTPWDLVGKSGAIAAMVEHGLPVIVNVEGGTPGAPLVIQEQFEPLILNADEQLLLKLPAPLRQKPVPDNLSFVAEQFLLSLEASGSPKEATF